MAEARATAGRCANRAALACLFIVALCLAVPVSAQTCSGLSASDARLETLRGEWRATASNPLIGRVWAAGALADEPAAKTCRPSALADIARQISGTIAAHGIVLMGEIHDNPAHHRLRGEFLHALAERLRDPANPRSPPPAGLVFEHIRRDQQAGLDRFAEFDRRARRLGTSGDLFRFLDWDKSGWGKQSLFEPLFKAAIEGKFPLLPGEPPREIVRTIAKEGLAAVGADDTKRYGLDQPLAPALQDALLGELEASHCGMMPKSAFATMSVAQRYRDAHMADALAKAADTHGSAVLLAGNGHVRSDRGVPATLRRLAPGRSILSIMPVEVEAGQSDPDAYIPRDDRGQPVVDVVVFSPRAERVDPCVEMRARMRKP